MTPEERLRRAIAARAHSVEPSDDGLDRITEKLLAPGGDMKLPPTSPNTRWYLVAAAAIVLAGIAGAITLVSKDDDDGTDNVSNQPNPTVTLDPTTSPSTSSLDTTTTTQPGEAQMLQALWPRSSSDVRFDDPVAAASSFARFYLGLENPVIGEYLGGDTRSGEVEVRAAADRPITTVGVRQLDNGNWYVTNTMTENIDVTAPVIEDTLTCPVRLQGTALAFEGTVQIRIDAFQPGGERVEVARGHVTGSGSPPAGPFDEEIPCRIPDDVEPYAILTAYTQDEGEQVEGMLESTSQFIRLP